MYVDTGSMTPQEFEDKWGMNHQDYQNLPQASAGGGDIKIASHDKPFSHYPAAGGPDKWPGLPGSSLDILHPSKDPLLNIPITPYGIKAQAKRDKDYSLGAYVGGTTSKTSKTSKKKKKKKDTMVASYKPQGKLISEGWASPKHTDIDKDEKKRWFSEKDIKPEYPKEKPPKMVNGYHPKLLPQLDTPIPYIKVKNKDLLRNHKLTKDEAQKWTSLIDKLNAYIMRNPNMLAYARERYPKSDPHLAALNYKMDMQLAAADEYIETRFPENKRLYGKLMQATKRSIDLTDPKTFKSRKGKMTSINKLMRVDYVMSEYDPTDKEVKNKRIKSNKKSIGRFFRKPKKKTKSDILKDKMAVLDNEMKKTMPEA